MEFTRLPVSPLRVAGVQVRQQHCRTSLPRQASRASAVLHHVLEQLTAALVVRDHVGRDLERFAGLRNAVAAVEQHGDLSGGFQLSVEPNQEDHCENDRTDKHCIWHNKLR